MMPRISVSASRISSGPAASSSVTWRSALSALSRGGCPRAAGEGWCFRRGESEPGLVGDLVAVQGARRERADDGHLELSVAAVTLPPMATGPATCPTRLAYSRSQVARYMEGARSRYISDALMREIYLRDNGTCQKCSKAVGPRAARFDHIIPWSEDGDTVPWNLQVLCESCNLAKGNRMDGQDHKKLWELGAGIWMVHALLYHLDAPGLFANPSERKAALRSVLLDLRDLVDDAERALEDRERPGSARPCL